MLLCKNRSRAINAKRKLLSAVLTIALSGAAVEVRAGGLPANEQERTELRLFLKAAIDKSDSFADRFDAEVWLLDMSTRLTPFMHDPEERLDLLRTIHREAKRAQL
jgi:hypothetical protein